MGSNERQRTLSSPLWLRSTSNSGCPHTQSQCLQRGRLLELWSKPNNIFKELEKWGSGKKSVMWKNTQHASLAFMNLGSPSTGWPHPQHSMPVGQGRRSKAASWQLIFATKFRLNKSTIMKCNSPPAALPGPVNCLQVLEPVGTRIQGQLGKALPPASERLRGKERVTTPVGAQKRFHLREKLYPPER